MGYTFLVLGIVVAVVFVYVATRKPDPDREDRFWRNPFVRKPDDK